MRFTAKPSRTMVSLCVAVLAIAVFAFPAHADEVLAGHDLWSTPPGGAVEDFGGNNTPDPNDDSPPIPPGFFDPGSDPFIGQVSFCGTPLGTYLGQPTGNADTIVERVTDTNFGGGQTDVVSIELVALSLVSCAPITVTYGGTNPQLWDIDVSLSATSPSLGTMTLIHDQADPGGGTYDAAIAVCSAFTFTRQGDGAVRFVDFCGDFDPAGQVVAVAGQPWVHNAMPPLHSPWSGPNFFVIGTTLHDGPHPEADPIETPAIPAVPGPGGWMLLALSALLLAALGFRLVRVRTA